MEWVKEVHQLDDRRLRWQAEIMGKDVTWEAEITEQVPDQRVVWRSTNGARNDGLVAFQPLGPERTNVILTIDYEPEGMVEESGSTLGLVSARVEGDLRRFKEFIERRGVETGAWRGEIRGVAVEGSPVKPRR